MTDSCHTPPLPHGRRLRLQHLLQLDSLTMLSLRLVLQLAWRRTALTFLLLTLTLRICLVTMEMSIWIAVRTLP